MQIELTRDEVEAIIEAVDMRRDSAIDTKNDLVRWGEAEEAGTLQTYIEELQGILNKLNNALL